MSPVKRFARKTLFIAIGAHRIDCGVSAGNGSGALWIKDSVRTVEIDAADGIESRLHALTAALAKLQALPFTDVAEVHVVVADSWLAVAGVPWSPRVKRANTAEIYARAQLAGAGFDIEPADTLRLDDAPFGEPRLAVVYPAVMLTALSQFASRLNARLSTVLPLALAAWELAQRQSGIRAQALAVLDAGLMVLARAAVGRSSRLSEVTVRADASLHEAWQRQCLRDPQLSAVKQIALLDLTQPDESKRCSQEPFVQIDLPSQGEATSAVPSLHLAASTRSSHHVLNALPRAPNVSTRQWLVLGISALLAGTLLVQALQTHFVMRSLTARLNASAGIAQPAPLPTAWTREELARVQAVNAAIRELNMPISPILRALEPPRDIRVAVLSVETATNTANAQASSVKIVAEARTAAEMARYVAFVAERKPFTGAYLTRHEIDQATPEQPYRFTVEAAWSE